MSRVLWHVCSCVCAHAAAAQALAARELEGAPLLLLANKLDIAGRMNWLACVCSAAADARWRAGADGVAAVAAAFASLTEDRPERPARVVEARATRASMHARSLPSCLC